MKRKTLIVDDKEIEVYIEDEDGIENNDDIKDYQSDKTIDLTEEILKVQKELENTIVINKENE